MALIEIRAPTPSALRWFGLPAGAVFALAGALAWRAGTLETAYALWGGGAGLLALYYAVPALRKTIYLGWMYAAYPLGWLMSHVVMALIYFLVVTPIGLLSRVSGRDPLRRELRGPGHEQASEWQVRGSRRQAADYFRQY